MLPILYPLLLVLMGLVSSEAMPVPADAEAAILFPAAGAVEVNPDTHLQITFSGPPQLGKSGCIRIYDASNHHLVDTLDLGVPPGPTAPASTPSAVYTPVPYAYAAGRSTNANTKPGTPSGAALPNSDRYQLTIIGGFTDAFHFYPVIVCGNTATIHLHHNLLEYGKTYFVTVDPEVFTLKGARFYGIHASDAWSFTTRKMPPPSGSRRLVVSADGKGDFSTVQGAVDFVPDHSATPVTIFVKNGMYEEIVYFRNKSNLTIVGEDRNKVVVFYANNEVFNPHPVNIKTNEVPGTFPSRRAAFAVDHSRRIHLVNLTIKTTAYGQAEGLLLNGEEIIVSHVTIVGSGDALQANGSAYFTDCQVKGDGDTILGRGPAYFHRCEFSSLGPYMWIRNTEANHGYVFVNSRFQTRENRETVLARAPTNGGKNYPHAEAVLIDCALDGIDPVGWGEIGDPSHVHYWEYNSVRLRDGTPIDSRRRHPASRQLTLEKDGDTIARYRTPSYVLGGWNPAMAPLILAQPQSAHVSAGDAVRFEVQVAAVPDARYQWYKNHKPIPGATASFLALARARASDAGRYTVRIENASGRATSRSAMLKVR